jgi:hypothetical protein
MPFVAGLISARTLSEPRRHGQFTLWPNWNQNYNRRMVENEVKKLDPVGKRELAEQLVEQADQAEPKAEMAKA